MSTINRSSHTGLVPVPNETCYDDHMFRLGVLIVYYPAAVEAFKYLDKM